MIILIQTEQTATVIIILAQDVIMEATQAHGRHRMVVIPIRHRNSKLRRGGIIVIHLQRFLPHLPIVHHHRLMVVHQVAEVRQVVVEEAEVQDNFNKTLTSMNPLKNAI